LGRAWEGCLSPSPVPPIIEGSDDIAPEIAEIHNVDVEWSSSYTAVKVSRTVIPKKKKKKYVR